MWLVAIDMPPPCLCGRIYATEVIAFSIGFIDA
jgi:hypothetical protein